MIVLYDGDCGFCRATVAWALERNPELTAAPIQSDTGAQLLHDLTPAQRLAEVHVIEADGRRVSGGAAVRTVLATLPATRPLARVMAIAPRATEGAYRVVARNRRRLGRLVSRPGPLSGTRAGSPRTGGDGPPRRGGCR